MNNALKNEVIGSSRVLAKGYVVSNDTRKTGLNNNDCIIGPSGAGKTGGIVIPNMLRTDHSMVVADTKGRLYREYGALLKSKGFKVVCVDFVHPERSKTGFNVLDNVSWSRKGDKVQYRQIELRKIAKLLIRDELSREEQFWTETSRFVLVSLMAYALEALPREEQNMMSVVKLYQKLAEESTNKEEERHTYFDELEEEDSDSFAVNMYKMYRGTFEAEKTWGCIQAFTSNALDLFTYKESKEFFSGRRAVNFSELGKKKVAMFVNISDTDRSMDAIVNIFYSQLFQALFEEADSRKDGRLKMPVRIFLDDFAANVYIPEFDKISSVIRSREIYVSVILQSISQLDSMYDNGARATIINNCDHLIYLGGQDPDTAGFIARKAGQTVESVMHMDLNKAWVFERGGKPMLVDKIKPYSFEKEITA